MGDNCRIGANAVVWEDVPDSTLVVVGEQRMISKDALDNRFYAFRGGRWAYYDDGNWVILSPPEEKPNAQARQA